MIIIFQLVGFGFLVFGNLVYNKMVGLPCLKKRERSEMLLNEKRRSEEVSS